MYSSKCVETVVLCVIIALLWGLLALPTVFYHLPQVSSELDAHIYTETEIVWCAITYTHNLICMTLTCAEQALLLLQYTIVRCSQHLVPVERVMNEVLVYYMY